MRRFATAGIAAQRSYVCAPCLRKIIHANGPLTSNSPGLKFQRNRQLHATSELDYSSEVNSSNPAPDRLEQKTKSESKDLPPDSGVLDAQASSSSKSEKVSRPKKGKDADSLVAAEQKQDGADGQSKPDEDWFDDEYKKRADLEEVRPGFPPVRRLKLDRSNTSLNGKDGLSGSRPDNDQGSELKTTTATERRKRSRLRASAKTSTKTSKGSSGSEEPATKTPKKSRIRSKSGRILAKKAQEEARFKRLEDAFANDPLNQLRLGNRLKVMSERLDQWKGKIGVTKTRKLSRTAFDRFCVSKRQLRYELLQLQEQIQQALADRSQKEKKSRAISYLTSLANNVGVMLTTLINKKHLHVRKKVKGVGIVLVPEVNAHDVPQAVIGQAMHELQRYHVLRKILHGMEEYLKESEESIIARQIVQLMKMHTFESFFNLEESTQKKMMKEMHKLAPLFEKSEQTEILQQLMYNVRYYLRLQGREGAVPVRTSGLIRNAEEDAERGLKKQIEGKIEGEATGEVEMRAEGDAEGEIEIDVEREPEAGFARAEKYAEREFESLAEKGESQGTGESRVSGVQKYTPAIAVDSEEHKGIGIAHLPGMQKFSDAIRLREDNEKREESNKPEPISKAKSKLEQTKKTESGKTSEGEPASERQAVLAKKSLATIEQSNIDSNALELEPIHVDQPPVRNLAYGLDRVLFNPGVYMLREPRSKVYNFDPYLEKIMPLENFNFDLIPDFVTSSKDRTLQRIAHESGKRYTGSSSSMTGVLSQMHFLLSRFRPINTAMMSRTFNVMAHHSEFSNITKAPSAVFLRWKPDEGLYAIDSDKVFDEMNGLSLMGNSLEKLLTLPTDKYERYRHGSTDKIPQEESDAPETYHYTGLGDILMRSQLDAHDPRLPGTGMFDLKTRAVLPVRMDVAQFRENSSYEIRLPRGNFESYEREYMDMLRATMVKYMLQVRIGRMDGIFVAYHNTRRIFGFQYVPLEEIDLALHGQRDRSLGDAEFKISVKLMNEIFNKATERFPNTTLRMHFAVVGGQTLTRMQIFAEPFTEEDADSTQHKNVERNKKIVKEILSGASPTYDEDRKRVFSSENVSSEAKPEESSNLSEGASGDEPGLSSETEERPLLAFELSTTNVVNGKKVARPGFLAEPDESRRIEEISSAFSKANDDEWHVEYQLKEMTDPKKAREQYNSAVNRRKKLVGIDRDQRDLGFIRDTLRPYVESGRRYREAKDKEEGPNPTRVVLRE